jgi:hypothetical protein
VIFTRPRHIALLVGALAAVAAGIAIASAPSDPYPDWPTEDGSPSAGLIVRAGQVPHPNMMVILTCTPQGMKVDRRFLVGTKLHPYNYVDLTEASYAGGGLCIATWKWRNRDQMSYFGDFSSELKPEAIWSELGPSEPTPSGDNHAFVEQGNVRVLLVEVHVSGLPLGDELRIASNGSPVPPHP